MVIRASKIRMVQVWGACPNKTEDERPQVFAKTEARLRKWLPVLNAKHHLRFSKVFVNFDEMWHSVRGTVPVRRPRPGFFFEIDKTRSGLDVTVASEFTRASAARRNDAELASDFVEAAKLMIERMCWQENLGTYRERVPDWKSRTMREQTVFTGLVRSERGRDLVNSSDEDDGHELVVRCPQCEEREWPGLWKQVEGLLSRSQTVIVEDAGYIVPKRTLELTLTGDEAALKALVAKLKPIFKGRTGAGAILRLAFSTAKGRSFKLA